MKKSASRAGYNFARGGFVMTNSTAADVWHGRVEDDPLLKGTGRFGDDVKPEGALAAYFVRSPHAFARISAYRRHGGQAGEGRQGGVHRRRSRRGALSFRLARPSNSRPRRQDAVLAASSGAGGRAGDACGRAGSDGRGRQRRRGAGGRASRWRSITSRSIRLPRYAPVRRKARRSSGRKRPAISASTGPRRPIPTARSRPRSSAPSRKPPMW